MKFTKIALALAAMAVAQNAAAVEVYMSGASALRDVIPLVMDKICQPAASFPRAMYEAGATISGTKTSATATPANTVNVDNDRRVFTCHTHSATSNSGVATDLGANADVDLVLYWSNEIGDSANGSSGPLDKLLGGSITGIAPLAPFTSPATQQATVNFLDYTNTATPAIANGTDTTFGATNGSTVYGVSVKGFGFAGASKFVVNVQKSGIQSDIGVSDVEPKLFTTAYKNVPTSIGSSTVPAEWQSFDITALTNSANSKAAFIGSFGVAIQDAVPTTGSTAVTNLSEDQLAQILSGTITNWQSVGGPNLAIKVCTRAPGSGTKATFNQLVSRVGCKSNSLPNGDPGFEYNVRAATTISNGFRSFTGAAGFGVREGATTGDVQTCLTDNKTAGGTSTVAGGGTAVNNGAVGILGLDAAASVSTTAGYHFVAVNGVNPVDLTNATDTVDGSADKIREDLVALGQYPLWVESTVQKNPSLSDSNKLAFYDYMSAHSGDAEYTTKFPGVLTLDDARAGAQGLSHTLSRGDSYYQRGGDTCSAPSYK